jgi:hypothetical protein
MKFVETMDGRVPDITDPNIRLCRWCLSPIEGKYTIQIYCSTQCRLNYMYQINKEWRDNRRETMKKYHRKVKEKENSL